MEIIMAFAPIKNRDAYYVIRGYVYQVNLTIERWLQLHPNQILELECGEDIDTISSALGSGQEERLLEQVKHNEKPLTLRNPNALKALIFAIHTRNSNPDSDLLFRYTTNANIACERPPIFESRKPAIQVWENLRTNRALVFGQQKAAKALREFLKLINKPIGINDDIWKTYSCFVESAPDSELVRFIEVFEWSTGEVSAEEIKLRIPDSLIEARYADNAQDAKIKYERLFFYVFNLLSQKSAKRLTRHDLDEQLTLPVLRGSDQDKLSYIQNMLDSFAYRLSAVEQVTKINRQSVKQIEATVQKLAEDQDINANVAYISVDPIIDIPPQVPHISKRTEAVSEIMKDTRTYTWIALTGTIGSGKTQLAILLAKESNTCKAWISLRGKEGLSACHYFEKSMDIITGCNISVTGRERYRKMLQKLEANDLIVLDDIPPLQDNTDLSDRFLLMIEECMSKGVKVISTSTYPPSNNFLSSAGGKLKVIAVPALCEPEINEILRASGAKQEESNKWSKSVYTLSYGHPVLAVAISKHLRSMDWKVSSLDQFNSLFVRQSYSEEIKSDTTRRLVETVQDSDSRELIYRLNLVLHDFDLEDVEVVASVKPPVHRPIERLTLLDGLWIQHSTQNTYAMSPLIKRLGHNDIPPKRRKAIHYLLGNKILSKRTLDIWDASNVVMYFVSAEAFQNALVVFSQALYTLSQQENLQDDAILGLLWTSAPLPDKVDLSLRIFVRALQIKVNTKLKRDVTYEVLDLGNLVQSSQDGNQHVK